MIIRLTEAEHTLLQKIIRNVHETRSTLSVAEQINEAYTMDGSFNKEKTDRISKTFDSLRYEIQQGVKP